MTTTSLAELSRLRSAFDTLASSAQAADTASPADGGNNQLLPSLALLVTKAHAMSGNADFVGKRDDEVAAMVKEGKAIDPSFPLAAQAASWKPSPGLPVEYGAEMSQDALREKATQARQTRKDIDGAKRRTFSSFDTVASKTILVDAIQSSGRNAKSIRDALKYDVSQRYGRREWLFRWRQSDYDPGEQQRVGRQKRRDHYAARALEKSITLAVDTVRRPENGLNVETATVALALAVASDKELMPAFRDHQAFRDLVGSVASENQALGRLVDLAKAWPDKREEAGSDGLHAILDPELIHKMRLERDSSAESDVTDTAARRETHGTEPDGDTQSSGRNPARIERDRHQEYEGKIDSQRSTTFSSHAFNTTLRQFALLQVPGGDPVEILSRERQTPRQMNEIRERIHRARIEAAGMVETAGSSDQEKIESRLKGRLVIKITENTGYETRPAAERRSRTRQYSSGAGEVAQDLDSRTIYVTPREIMSDKASDMILRRVAATAGLDMPRRSEPRSPETPEPHRNGETNSEIDHEVGAMTNDTPNNAPDNAPDNVVGNTPNDAERAPDRPQTPADAGRDVDQQPIDAAASDGSQSSEHAPDGHPFKTGDRIELLEDSTKLEMNRGRTLTVQWVDHETGDTEIINDEDEDGAFNYKTDAVKFTRLEPSREPENTLDTVEGGSNAQIPEAGMTGLRRLNSRKSRESIDRDAKLGEDSGHDEARADREHHAVRSL